ncbi:MAG TPA: xanthine dehydrogenase family protein molybdopterin-binding subunit [Haliangiales bacterium]|nr:xanthine dehydrogenase family protein molybdopterin-binding subunit [Haliangiales bacterium]
MTIGAAVPRKEAVPKLTGAARYVDDLVLPGMIHGVTVRSRAPRGRILAIRFGSGVPWDEIVVVTARDIPGRNCIRLLLDDQPCLADGFVNHPEEPVLLLAHADRALLDRARAAVEIDVEPAPAVLTLADSLAGGTVVWGTDNIFKEYRIEKGDVDRALAAADVVVEGTYETGAQEQLYIEPQGAIAQVDRDGAVTVWGSMQCPYYVQKALMPLFAVGPEKARVIQVETGGGFGGKEEYPSMIAAHAALLARKAGRPVKIVYDREEDMAATTKRHPSRTRHRTALARDGRILGLDIDFVIDGGAYATLSSVVLSRGAIHAAGPYECADLRIRARAVATNAPPHGAFRGFGAPQSIFALERHLDECAARLGMAPDELRRRNFVQKGGTLATGQVVRDDIDMGALLDEALARSDFHERRRRFAAENPTSRVKRGMGLAAFLHGTGFTGAGEKHLQSVVAVEGTAEGRVRVLAASTEIGQGTNTVFAQIAADALGVPYDAVDVAQPDTAHVPNSGPTVASRTVTIVGKLVEAAARDVKAALAASGAADIADHVARHGPLRAVAEYLQPPYVSWDETTFRGDAYGAFSWAVYVAQVAVDTVTFEARVEDFVAVQEVGRVMHPVLAVGQIEGGVAQGIGWALTENVVWRDGRMANCRMTDYIIPTSVDVPPIRAFFVESPYAYGPHGAKGIGELPMDGPAPAIANAIRDALGVSPTRIPATPETIEETIEEAHG